MSGPQTPAPGSVPMETGVTKWATMMSINSALYGLHAAVAIVTLYFSFTAKGSNTALNAQRHLSFVGLLLLLGTVNFALSMAHSVVALFHYLRGGPILDFDFVRGQVTAELDLRFLVPAQVMALFITILCHGLMMYRCYIIWNQSKRVLILPGAVFLLLIAFSILSTLMKSTLAVESVIYTPALLALNVILTLLVCGRIAWCKIKIRRLLGEKFTLRGWDRYGAASIVIESSLVYTIATIFAIATGIRPIGDSADRTSVSLLTQVECITSELIILRVALGRAFKQEWATMAVEGTATKDPEAGRAVTAIQFARSVGVGTTDDVEALPGA